jgi:hypothetical protein
MAVALLILRQILDFRMKMGGRQVEMKVSSYISEHHSLYKISSLKAKSIKILHVVKNLCTLYSEPSITSV